MRLIIMIFWGLVLYFIFKAVVGFLRQIAQSGSRKESNNNGSERTNYTSEQVNNHKYNIKKDDIVDADFVEIKPDNEKKTEK